MKTIDKVKIPSKADRIAAMESYHALSAVIDQLKDEVPEIEIEETQKKIRIPIMALRLLTEILKETGKGNLVTVVPIATEMTTQAASEYLGVSRPYFVKLLEESKMPYIKVGRHRRVKFKDVQSYKNEMKVDQKKVLKQIISDSEELGLYDS